MKNEQLLNEIEQLFKSFDDESDEIKCKLAKLEGTVSEMIRHNGRRFDDMEKMYDRFIKILLGIIVTLFIILMAILGIKGSIPIPALVMLFL